MEIINIKQFGDTQGIELSEDILAAIGIDDPQNQELVLQVEDNKLILSKKDEQSRLMQNFGYLLDETNAKEIEWGKDVGKEAF